jgi:hypothetical protein
MNISVQMKKITQKTCKNNKTLRGGIEPPRHFRTTGFPGLRPTARLPQQKAYLIY